MYKVVLTAVDENAGVETYKEELFDGHLFASKDSAEVQMLRAMNEELSDLNQPDAYNTPRTQVYIADLNGGHSAIIRLWDGDQSWDITYYDIERVKLHNA